MSSHRHAIGLGFGTESGRAVLVAVTSDRAIVTAVHICEDHIQAGP
jgi:ribulose kinase